MSSLGISFMIGSGKYLGLPSIIGKKKKQVFGFLKDRLWRRINHWSGKHLSKAGKEVLLKSCAQAICFFCMSVYWIPLSHKDEIKKMMNFFWWGTFSDSTKGTWWLNWENLTMKKEFGGLDFKHLHGFNLAMLGKQGWNFTTNHGAIVTQVFKAKYFLNYGFLDAHLSHNLSYTWHNIHAPKVLVKEGWRWRIGNGKSVNVWPQPWLHLKDLEHVTMPPSLGLEHWIVDTLIDQANHCWNSNLIKQVYNTQDVQHILSLVLMDINVNDK